MKGKQVLRRCAEALDLPTDLVAGEMKIELTEGELYLTRHRGLMSYSETLIDVNAGELIVRVKGEGLQLLAMSEEELRIGGEMHAVELLR
ncbi:MAG: sporulation protein [Oscillospiraceae bacterium]|nr:sporulation protein [Oscillospiraceae bacterium]